MNGEIERMLDHYESGRMSRRQLVVGLGAMAAGLAGGGFAAQEPPPPKSTFKATGLDHIALYVSDVNRSRDFYVKHLGLTVRRQSGNQNCFMDCGPHNFVALFRRERPGSPEAAPARKGIWNIIRPPTTSRSSAPNTCWTRFGSASRS